jgi:hypothetical protein
MLGPDEFGAVVRPENLPVNDSPWFAFRVRSETEKTITLRLRCQGGSLRYRPKISLDGTQWLLLPEECYQQTEDRKEAVLKLEIGPRVLHVAAQEPVSRAEMEDWAALCHTLHLWHLDQRRATHAARHRKRRIEAQSRHHRSPTSAGDHRQHGAHALHRKRGG